jgi:hypothetical protein
MIKFKVRIRKLKTKIKINQKTIVALERKSYLNVSEALLNHKKKIKIVITDLAYPQCNYEENLFA